MTIKDAPPGTPVLTGYWAKMLTKSPRYKQGYMDCIDQLADARVEIERLLAEKHHHTIRHPRTGRYWCVECAEWFDAPDAWSP